MELVRLLKAEIFSTSWVETVVTVKLKFHVCYVNLACAGAAIFCNPNEFLDGMVKVNIEPFCFPRGSAAR